jgi:hypothetical protein
MEKGLQVFVSIIDPNGRSSTKYNLMAHTNRKTHTNFANTT